MKIRAFAALMACSLASVACNDVPVRNLTSSYQLQIQELRDRGKPAKLDILWVVDDSPSMCQEQQSLATSFKAFLEVFQKYTAIDMQLAVTTTNVCAKNKPGAVRGKFVYEPAKEVAPDCVEKRVISCRSDADCLAYSTAHPEAPLPDPTNWVCEKRQASDQWTCDTPQAVKDQGGVDTFEPGDYLFTFTSQCRYRCTKETDVGAAACARVFGQPDGCAATSATGAPLSMCENSQCSTGACEGNAGLTSTVVDCASRCRGRECTAVCADFLTDATQCQAKCEAANGSCIDVCQVVSKVDECGAVCQSDWTCQQKCEGYLHDAARCQAVCAKGTLTECRTECNTQFTNQDFLCLLSCDSKYDCTDRCTAQFGAPTYRCLYPGNDKTIAGCVLPPATNPCPAVAEGPRMLNNTVADQWLKEWIAGRWGGDPDWDIRWKQLPTGDSTEDFAAREVARSKVFEQLFKCMATLGTQQTGCALQEQGLRAAWMALDTEGENADQARKFLRDDAYLLIVAVGDEDDCSAPEYKKADNTFDNVIPAEQYGRCTCQRDELGCTPAGDCDPSLCLTNGSFDAKKCPLYSTARFVNLLRSLKPDPAQVVFASITGGVIAGSTTSPSDDLAAITSRYFDCKCSRPGSPIPPLTYGCLSDGGKADLGVRFAEVTKAFGLGTYGQLSNICSDAGIRPALESIANLVIPLLTQVCLPRPLEWSCHGKCESLFNDRDACQVACAASDCFTTCQDTFAGKPGCAAICSSGEFIEVYKYDAKGNCAKVDAGGNCLPMKFAPNADADGDYSLVQNSPVCPLFYVTQGERLENAIQFRTPLEYSDRIEIVFRAAAFSCQDRCGRVFRDQATFCDTTCNGTTEACLDNCTKAPAARNCGYVCGTRADTCIQQCTAAGRTNCTAICRADPP
jgi:hypothetical protein